MSDDLITRLLLESLTTAPPLIGSLPEAESFDIQRLSLPEKIKPLNFRQKLGHLYEEALGVLLTNTEQLTLLQQNVQIQKDKHTTVGELDYLIRDLSSGNLIHLELATKFYLALETPSGTSLPGPDARDNYHRKLKRLREHQLQLPKKHRENLPASLREEPIVSQQLIHGCLFDHISATSLASPEYLNPDCRRGKWLHLRDLSDHLSGSPAGSLIPKPLWPVPLSMIDEGQLESWNPPSQLDRCVMIKIPGSHTPYFVAPDGYPDHGEGMR